jgi:hypothetical protein
MMKIQLGYALARPGDSTQAIRIRDELTSDNLDRSSPSLLAPSNWLSEIHRRLAISSSARKLKAALFGTSQNRIHGSTLTNRGWSTWLSPGVGSEHANLGIGRFHRHAAAKASSMSGLPDPRGALGSNPTVPLLSAKA